MPHASSSPSTLRLWSGWLLGPGAWALHLGASYLLVEWACRTGEVVLLHATTVVAAVLALAGILLEWTAWRGSRRRAGGADATGERIRFMAAGGMVLSAFFLAIVLAQGIPDFVLSPCHH